MARGDVERLFQLLASEGVLGERFERNALGYTNAYVTLGQRYREVLSGKMPLTMSLSNGKKVANGNTGGYETEYDEDEGEEDEIEVVPTQAQTQAQAGARPTRQAAAEAKQRLGRTGSALSVEGGAPDESLEGRALSELLQARAAVSDRSMSAYHGSDTDVVPGGRRPRSNKISTPRSSSARTFCR